MATLTGNTPRHIAIIMDGNGRWAKAKRLPVAAGHKAGAENVRSILKRCKQVGVQALTLYAFSTENWQRPALEVKALMVLFSDYLDQHIQTLKDEGVRVRFIGGRDKFQAALLKKIEWAESETAHNTSFHLTLAVDYGGKWDITEAARRLAERVAEGALSPEAITEGALEQELALYDVGFPDLLIRTSGEYRISNFLLWQLAYSEFYFAKELWPDFDEAALDKALMSFAQRQRRFGGRDNNEK